VSQEDIERRRAIVLEAFPGAARPRGRERASRSREAVLGSAAATAPAAGAPVTPARRREVVRTERPDFWELLRATLFVLVLAPVWLFASIWAYRGGQPLVGTVLLFASGFAALSGLITASPSSFDRRWLWVWGALGLGVFGLLGFGAVHAACAGWSAVAE
jgi:hypothetical protein